MENHHPLIARALDWAEGADDEQSLAEIKNGFLLIDRVSRKTLLDNMARAMEDDASMRQRAELLALSRELTHAHQALNKVGR
jgi:hypothetical protein